MNDETPRIVYQRIKIAAALLAAAVAIALRVDPDGALADRVLTVIAAHVAVYTFFVVGAGVILLPLVLVAAAVLLFAKGRHPAWLLLFWYVRWQILAGVGALTIIAILMYPSTIGPGALVALGAAVLIRLTREWGPLRLANLAVNVAIAFALVSPFADRLRYDSVNELVDQWDARVYFPPAELYDATPNLPDRRLVSAVYGGGLFTVDLTKPGFPITGRIADMYRPEKVEVCGDRVFVQQNASGDPDKPDGFSFRLDDLSDRREIRLETHHKIGDIACDMATRTLFMIDEDAPTMVAWDMDTESVKQLIPVEPNAHRIDFNEFAFDEIGRRIYACSWVRGSNVYVVDADALALTTKIPVGGSVSDAAIDAVRGLAYFARPLSRGVDVYRTESVEKTGRIGVAPGTRKLLLLEDGRWLAVGSYFNGTLEVIRVDDPARRVSIRAFPRIRNLRYDAVRDELLVVSKAGVIGFPMDEFRERLNE